MATQVKNPETGRYNLQCVTCGQQMCGQDVETWAELVAIRDKVGWTQNPNPVCAVCGKSVSDWRDGDKKPRLVLKKRRRVHT